MPPDPATATLLVLILVPWLICMWAMVMLLVTAKLNEGERFSLGQFLAGSYFFERYNRKYLLSFLCALAFAASIVIAANVLFFTGRINF